MLKSSVLVALGACRAPYGECPVETASAPVGEGSEEIWELASKHSRGFSAYEGL